MVMDPGANLTSRNRLAQMLMAQEQGAAPIQSHTQGLASLLRQGLAGFMQGADTRDRSQAYRTMIEGLQAKPWVDPDTGQVAPNQNPTGGFAGAIAGLKGLSGNETAEGLIQQIGIKAYEQEEAARRAASDRAAAREDKAWEWQNKPTEPTTSMREYETAKSQGFQGSFLDYQKSLAEARRSQTIVNNNQGGAAPPRYIPGSAAGLPSGWRYDTLNDRAEPIPGGPAAVEAAEVAAKGEQRQEAKEIQGVIVMDEINRAIAAIQENPRFVTGAGGGLMSGAWGTPAHDLSQTISTIQANTAFDTLQGMREASPTGGALGGVSAPELTFLRDTKGALAQTQSADQLTYNLTRLGDAYMDAVHGTPQQIMQLAADGKISFEVATQLAKRSEQYQGRGGTTPDASGSARTSAPDGTPNASAAPSGFSIQRID